MPILAIRFPTRSLKLKQFGRNQRLHAMGQTHSLWADSVKINQNHMKKTWQSQWLQCKHCLY